MRAAEGTDDAVSAATSFDRFTEIQGERLRRVLVARYGVDVGNDVHADALAYAWKHWERVATMANPVGYLYRVAQSASRRHRRWRRHVHLPPELRDADGDGPVDVGLHVALARLPHAQRTCVVLVHVFDWSYREAAEALDVPVSTVRNHLHRGLAHLRTMLEDNR